MTVMGGFVEIIKDGEHFGLSKKTLDWISEHHYYIATQHAPHAQ